MNPDVQNLILQQFAELKDDVKELGEKVDLIASRLMAVEQRVTHLEKEAVHTRWIWGGAGAIIALAVKEFISFTIKNWLPALNEAAASAFLALL